MPDLEEIRESLANLPANAPSRWRDLAYTHPYTVRWATIALEKPPLPDGYEPTEIEVYYGDGAYWATYTYLYRSDLGDWEFDPDSDAIIRDGSRTIIADDDPVYVEVNGEVLIDRGIDRLRGPVGSPDRWLNALVAAVRARKS
jgi:hypothetical protein